MKVSGLEVTGFEGFRDRGRRVTGFKVVGFEVSGVPGSGDQGWRFQGWWCQVKVSYAHHVIPLLAILVSARYTSSLCECTWCAVEVQTHERTICECVSTSSCFSSRLHV